MTVYHTRYSQRNTVINHCSTDCGFFTRFLTYTHTSIHAYTRVPDHCNGLKVKGASGKQKHGCSVNRCKALKLDGAYTLSQMVPSIRVHICTKMHGDEHYTLKEKLKEKTT